MKIRRVLFMGLLSLLGGVGCGSDDAGSGGNQIVLENGDDPLDYERDTVYVFCGPWESGLDVPAIHIASGSKSAFWRLSAVVSDVQLGKPYPFPNNFVWDQPKGVSVFAAHGLNEASSAEEESSGFVTFDALDCTPGAKVSFKTDAVLGSEYHDGRTVGFKGTFEGVVTEPPAESE